MQPRTLSRLAQLTLCLLSLCAAAPAQRQKAPKKPRPGRPATIVFVGNSYTHFHDLPAMLRALGRAAKPPRELTTVAIAPGGFTLEAHLAAEGPESAVQKIVSTRPDFVVLQEAYANTDTAARQSYEAVTRGFGEGFNGPLLVTVAPLIIAMSELWASIVSSTRIGRAYPLIC